MDWNLLLNIGAMAAIVIAAIRIGTARRQRETVTDLTAALEAKDRRIDALEDDMRGLGERADAAESKAAECELAVAKWEARYEELQRYTAREAVEHFEVLMGDHRRGVEERHAKMIDALARLTEAQQAQGELMLKVLEVSSKTAQHLDVDIGS